MSDQHAPHASPSTPAPSTPQHATSAWHLSRIAKIIAVLVVILSVIIGIKRSLSDPQLIQQLLDSAREHPSTAIPLFMVSCALARLVLLPSAPFLIMAGAVWGIPMGFAMGATATLASDMLAFAIGRHLLRPTITTYITANIPSFPAIQAAIVAEGWRLVLMLRLAPVLPDSVMNYLLSITDVSAAVYMATAAVATVVWSLLYLYIGSASTDIVATLTGGSGGSSPPGEGTSWGGMALTGGSLALAAGAFAYVGRVISKAIAKASEGVKGPAPEKQQ